MLGYGAIMFSGADDLAQELWQMLSEWAGLTVEKGGRWSAGTIYEQADPISNYVTFIGTPLVATVGYCGDSNFVSRLRDLTADFWPRIDAESFEGAFLGFNEEPMPRFHYFEGAQAPRFIGNRVYGAPVQRNWMAHISQEHLFKRKLLRNVYPINVLNAEHLDRLMNCPNFTKLVSSQWLDIFEFPNSRFGFSVELEQQALLYEMLSAADLIVEDTPVDPICFIPNARSAEPTLFPISELFESGCKLTV
jgi:hypothetical protein